MTMMISEIYDALRDTRCVTRAAATNSLGLPPARPLAASWTGTATCTSCTMLWLPPGVAKARPVAHNTRRFVP